MLLIDFSVNYQPIFIKSLYMTFPSTVLTPNIGKHFVNLYAELQKRSIPTLKLHKCLTHRDFLNWAGLVSCPKKTSIFLQNDLNTTTIESGLRFNNQVYLISEGKISQTNVYNGILGLRNIDVHVPRIERKTRGCKLEFNLF